VADGGGDTGHDACDLLHIWEGKLDLASGEYDSASLDSTDYVAKRCGSGGGRFEPGVRASSELGFVCSFVDDGGGDCYVWVNRKIFPLIWHTTFFKRKIGLSTLASVATYHSASSCLRSFCNSKKVDAPDA